jgi:NADPH:quinone reductase
MKTKRIVLTSRPNGFPTLHNFRIEEITLPEMIHGEVLLKGMYYSVDPYMRGRMNDVKSYIEPFQIDQPISGGVVAEVIESKSSHLNSGDLVIGILPWKEYSIISDKVLRKIDVDGVPPSYHLGVLGMTGLTAYFGLIHIGKPKKGETVVVSGAAGAVGIIVGQIAKIYGCYVVGITGSDEKGKLLKSQFGYDEVINYKTSKDIKKDILKICPDGVDVYFDNVGGDISDAVVTHINFNARIALCGQIATYNDTKVTLGPRWQTTLLTRSVLLQGFIINNYKSEFPEGIKNLSQWILEGKLKFTETIVEGFDELPNALLGLFKGQNTGKMIVKV